MSISNEIERVLAIEKHTGVGNSYYCPQIISKLLTNYMALAPLWSGIMVTRIKLSDGSNMTRDTNCHAELWFRQVKSKILSHKLHRKPHQFIQTMYHSLLARYTEHEINNNFDITENLKTDDSGPNFQIEKWCRRMPSKKGKHKSLYFNPPDNKRKKVKVFNFFI